MTLEVDGHGVKLHVGAPSWLLPQITTEYLLAL